jgi:hypothetical protein
MLEGIQWKWFFLGMFAVLCGLSASAQGRRDSAGAVRSGKPAGALPPYFQGKLIYLVSVKSKLDELSDKDAHKVLTIGNALTVTMKGGNYKLSTEYADTYIIKSDRKEYIKFRKIDTVFYLDFDSDTADVTGIIKNNAIVNIGGRPCKGITIETSKLARQYFYSTQLYSDPEDDRHNLIGQADVYARETGGALRLWIQTEYPYATETDSCVGIEQQPINDRVFRLPDLPISALFSAPRIIFPRYPGGDEAWRGFLDSTMNSKLTERYVKVNKGENEAWQTVLVEFVVAEDGSLSNFHVTNEDEVNPKLAEEAVRIMRLSRKWLPATFYGEKLKWTYQQGIEFRKLK